MCVLPLAGCPNLLEPQGFRSSWGEEARQKADLRDPGTVGVTLMHRVGQLGSQDYGILVTPWPCPELCVLAQSNFPGGAGVHFPWPSILTPQGGEVREERLALEGRGGEKGSHLLQAVLRCLSAGRPDHRQLSVAPARCGGRGTQPGLPLLSPAGGGQHQGDRPRPLNTQAFTLLPMEASIREEGAT